MSPHCPDEGVERRRLAGVSDDLANDTLRPLDLQVSELGDQILRREQDGRILRPAGSPQEVAAVVADHKQDSPRCERGCGVVEHLATLFAWQVQVQHDYKVERARLGKPPHDVGLDPGHLHAPIGSQLPRLGEPDAGEVDAGDVPAFLRKPYGVAPLAAGDVESSTWDESLGFRDEETVRLCFPDQLLGPVALVPTLTTHKILPSDSKERADHSHAPRR